MDGVLERISAGDTLILDGAIGTELERRGIPETSDASWAECMDDHAETVIAVHEDYIRAGADIITTNTFSSGLLALEKLDKQDRFEDWNRIAVDLARVAQARVPGGESCMIAGSISSFGNGAMNLTSIDGRVSWAAENSDRLVESFARQAEVLATAGVDVIVLEMLYATPPDTNLALVAAKSTGLPVFLSLAGMINTDNGGAVLQAKDGFHSGDIPGEPFGPSLAALDCSGVAAILAMHSEIDAVPILLDEISRYWKGLYGAYPNRTGFWDGAKWAFVQDLSPQRFAELALDWSDRGARIVGGCCGIGPGHIAAYSKALGNSR